MCFIASVGLHLKLASHADQRSGARVIYYMCNMVGLTSADHRFGLSTCERYIWHDITFHLCIFHFHWRSKQIFFFYLLCRPTIILMKANVMNNKSTNNVKLGRSANFTSKIVHFNFLPLSTGPPMLNLSCHLWFVASSKHCQLFVNKTQADKCYENLLLICYGQPFFICRHLFVLNVCLSMVSDKWHSSKTIQNTAHFVAFSRLLLLFVNNFICIQFTICTVQMRLQCNKKQKKRWKS